jgi:hypothetical protein
MKRRDAFLAQTGVNIAGYAGHTCSRDFAEEADMNDKSNPTRRALMCKN